MSPFRRNWEQYSFNKVELQTEETSDWEIEEDLNDNEDDMALLLDEAPDAMSRFMSRESRRGENREQPNKKQRPAWQ